MEKRSFHNPRSIINDANPKSVIKTKIVVPTMTVKTAAAIPVKNYLLQIPTRPRMIARGDKTKDEAKGPKNE